MAKQKKSEDIDKLKSSTQMFFDTLESVRDKQNMATIGVLLVRTFGFSYRNRKEIQAELQDMDKSEVIEYILFLARSVPKIFDVAIPESILAEIENTLQNDNEKDKSTS